MVLVGEPNEPIISGVNRLAGQILLGGVRPMLCMPGWGRGVRHVLAHFAANCEGPDPLLSLQQLCTRITYTTFSQHTVSHPSKALSAALTGSHKLIGSKA